MAISFVLVLILHFFRKHFFLIRLTGCLLRTSGHIFYKFLFIWDAFFKWNPSWKFGAFVDKNIVKSTKWVAIKSSRPCCWIKLSVVSGISQKFYLDFFAWIVIWTNSCLSMLLNRYWCILQASWVELGNLNFCGIFQKKSIKLLVTYRS